MANTGATLSATTRTSRRIMACTLCRHYVKGHGNSEGPVLSMRGGSFEGGERKLPAFLFLR